MKLLNLSLLCVALQACAAERPPAIDRERVLIGPVPLKRQLAWIDSALDRVVAIDASDDGHPRSAAARCSQLRPPMASACSS